MSAAALLAAAEALEAQAAELRRQAAALDGDGNGAQADRLVELGVAMAITKLSSTTLYRIAPRFGLGFKLPTGAWRFYEARLRAYMAPHGEIGEGDGEIGEDPPLFTKPNQIHLG